MAPTPKKLSDYLMSPTGGTASNPFQIRAQSTPATLGFTPVVSNPAPSVFQGGAPAASQAPVSSPAPMRAPMPTRAPAPMAVQNTVVAPVQSPSIPESSPIPQQWMKPGGGIYTPEEVAANIATKMTTSQGGGDIGQLSRSEFGPQKTAEELRADATNINNTRNDIAVGETDPYKVASQSGIAYTPAELAAIEKSYAGIYDPAINTAFAKLEAKQKSDALEAEFDMTLKKLAKTHDYDLAKMEKDNEYKVALEKMKMASDERKAAISAAAKVGTGVAGGYVAGENPVVDGWVDRILRSGEDITKAIPGVANQGLRNQVMLGLNSRRFESATTAGTLDDVNTINTILANPKLDNISGFFGQAVGGLFGQAKTAKTQFNQISGALQLAKAGNIKGQGAVSDYERKVLKEAAVLADRGQSDEDFRKALVKIRGAMMTASGLEAPVRIVDPATGLSDTQNLTSGEIADFIRDGALIEYVE